MATSQYNYETIRTLLFGSITTNFVAVGTVLNFPLMKYKIINETDVTLDISFDGINANDRIPAYVAYVEDIVFDPRSKNKLGAGTTLYVRHDAGAGPTVGRVSFSTAYTEID